MITVYGCPGTRSLRVVWALEEAGAAYDYRRVDLATGAGRKPPFIEINPGGKVPALVDGNFVLTESAAIVTWVGTRYPESGLLPVAATPHRAQYDAFCFFVLSELEQPLWTIAKHTFALPEKRRVPAILETAAWEYGVACRTLASRFGMREYAVGDGFTGADVLLAQTLAWGRSQSLQPGNEHLVAYVERMLGRPAATRARSREAAAA
jgi:glutathione S-transferase